MSRVLSRLGDLAGRRAILFLGTALIALAGLTLFLRYGLDSRSRADGAELLDQARTALAHKEYREAEDLASSIRQDDPRWQEGQLLAGEAATRAGQPQSAIAHYVSIPRDESPTAILAAFSLAEVYREVGRLSDAERAYAYVLDHQPEPKVHERMAFLLDVAGRRWEALPHFMSLVQSRNWTLDSLVLLGDLERPIEQGDYLRRCAEKSPDDVLVQMGLAADALAEGRSDEARARINDVIGRVPQLVAAQAMLGEFVVKDDAETFARWHASLAPEADSSPDIWYIRGLWARRMGDLRIAARCYWEALRLAPTHRRATYQMGQVLTSLGEASGDEFAQRAGQLAELTQHLDTVIRSEGQDQKSLRRVVELMESCGRLWEAWAWALTAGRFFPSAEWAQQKVAELSPLLKDDLPQVLESKNLALVHDFSEYPTHEKLLASAREERPSINAAPSRSQIRFEEPTGLGIDFVYRNGADPDTRGARMFEQTGGGIGVIDFDLDRFPDLYFPQGSEWKTAELEPTPSPEIVDRIYRNRGGRSFVDVTRETRLGDMGFGQGCAAGDFDNDGFPDIYVANVGLNRLYRNNGDGTFADVTDSSGVMGNDWTASCVIVDLNGDGLPDLYDVNYLTGPEIYERICNGRGCSPKGFPGMPGRSHLNRGDETFETVSDATPRDNSKGLGVVVADLTTRGRPSLFISNDQVANFLLRSVPAEDAFHVVFQEEAFLSGVAFNEDSVPMAGMGIAADDADGNGLLDFFVTNFKDESNTLFLQDTPGLFVDATRQAELRVASWPYVGWGTQFLDADLDGNPDIALVNGHVDDYRDEGGEYHMRPQFFRNLGGAKFAELKAEEVGPWFGGKYLGRGLSRLDWNRDGKMDFVVSNIGDRAALLENRSKDVGHFINLRLHATSTARDAIGTVVEVATNDRKWTKQLVAGDGYMASNERMLQFGLGEAAAVTEIQVRWPSGKTTTVQNPPIDVTIELVENREQGALQSE